MLEFWNLANNKPIIIAKNSIVMVTPATRQGSIVRYGSTDEQTAWVQETFEEITRILREESMLHLNCDEQISKLRAQVVRWRTAFKHMHASNLINDCCNACGLDLRDDIHLRLAEQ